MTPAVPVTQSPRYQAAAKEFYRITNTWSGGGTLNLEMQVSIAKWTARGLTKAALLEIADSLFGWVPPAGH